MKSDTVLDSAVFQLTPTRTRYDLVLKAHGKTEKLASGLLSPFVAHLKIAEEQVSKGGYSITLEPNHRESPSWFSKGTLERFVRFVSTPEILERVGALESEIRQLNEAIAVQDSDSTSVAAQIEDAHMSSVSNNGDNQLLEVNDEKALVPYKSITRNVRPKQSSSQQSSRYQLLKALGMRKLVLQKEQAMVFARAVAAGFDVDQIEKLIAFSECFGAPRLRNACVKFKELWKQKHVSGQWLEYVEAKATLIGSTTSGLSTLEVSFPEETRKHDAIEGSNQLNDHLATEWNVQSSNGVHLEKEGYTSANKESADEVSHTWQEYYSEQLQPFMYTQSPHMSGGSVLQYYPIQGMPFYPSHQGGAPFCQPQYVLLHQKSRDPVRGRTSQAPVGGKDAMLKRDSSEFAKSGSEVDEFLQTHGCLGQLSTSEKRLDILVSNHDSSQRDETFSNASDSPHSANDQKPGSIQTNFADKQHKTRRPKTSSCTPFSSEEISNRTEELLYDQSSGKESWKAFQKCLLQQDEENLGDNSLFVNEFSSKKRLNANSHLTHDQEFRGDSELYNDDQLGAQDKQEESNEMLTSSKRFQPNCSVIDLSIIEMEKGGGGYTRISNDEFEICKREIESFDQEATHTSQKEIESNLMVSQETFHSGFHRPCDATLASEGRDHEKLASDVFFMHRQFSELENSSSLAYPFTGNEYDVPYSQRDPTKTVLDESFVVPFRSISPDQGGTRMAIDMECEISSQKISHTFNEIRSCDYEPNDLILTCDGGKGDPASYDIRLDHERELLISDVNVLQNEERGNTSKTGNHTSRSFNNGKRVTLPKGKVESMRKIKPLRANPLAEAQSRAASLRSYKADLRKLKKEKEEEELKRLDALKRERQKRISARTLSAKPSASPTAQTGFFSSVKISPNSHSSKHKCVTVSDSPAMTAKRSDNNAVNSSHNLSRQAITSKNALNNSLSSLPESSNEDTSSKDAWFRRLSEPTRRKESPPLKKSSKKNLASKVSLIDEPEVKMSAIRNLDRVKSATLPELKTRASNVCSDVIKNAVSKEISRGTNGVNLPSTSRTTELDSSIRDESSIVEKTVVMLEPRRQTSTTVACSGQSELAELSSDAYHDKGIEKATLDSTLTNMPLPVVAESSNFCEYSDGGIEFEVQVKKDIEASSIDNVDSKVYSAPYARLSSMEDPTTITGTPDDAPHVNSDKDDLSSESGKPCSPVLIPENPNKSSKEASGKIRKLLKFGRKSLDSNREKSIVNIEHLNAEVSNIKGHSAAIISEVPTLKNLISKDESPVSGSAQKVLRPFSLLSPFRSRSSEKKMPA